MKNLTYSIPQTSFRTECLDSRSAGDPARSSFRQSEMFELIWIKKGKGAFTVDLENRQIADNTLFCLFPGQINRFTAGPDLVGYKIAFSREFLCGENALPHLPPHLDYAGRSRKLEVLRLNHEAQTEVESIVEMIIWENDNRQRLWAQMLHGLLKVLIAHFPSKFGAAGVGQSLRTDYQVFNRFMGLLDHKFTFQRQVSAYASDLAVTSNYLSEIVKRVSGYSASYHIQQRVLLEAQRKAVSSGASMKCIALELGFDDPSTFSKFFRTLTGINFSDFRKTWHKGPDPRQ
ncbi:AraC-type DNA-binding protein [Dyadobacter sp. SG02]|uniref:helix-turn-helix domain-containing protein n=1 Tax=Dyadobacter sp. SG02 TaxID=1855291 RepID=UPI0008B20E39|nr:helix-turn-helix domain-containing protein [Dyadobacter sp. SG02]SEI53393.1 AraC-type DNA-binding protein [Dyadobacter sp. SG02]